MAGIDDLLGAGVYYEAGPSEALACTDSRVVVVGGGNSAGQAVVRFSRYVRQVTLLVRGRDLGASMSQYLIDQLSGIPNVDVRVRTQVVSLEADDRLRALVVRSGDSAEPVRLPGAALIICIGGMPRPDGAAGIGLATNAAGYLVTGGDGALIAEPEISMTAAQLPGDHYSPGGTRQLIRVPQPAASSVLPETRLAVTGDLMNVAKALSVRVATRSLRHRWSDGPASYGSCPSECPSVGNAHRFYVRIQFLTRWS